jgi:hypothetical protein
MYCCQSPFTRPAPLCLASHPLASHLACLHPPAPAGMVDPSEKDDMLVPLDKRMRHLEITGAHAWATCCCSSRWRCCTRVHAFRTPFKLRWRHMPSLGTCPTRPLDPCPAPPCRPGVEAAAAAHRAAGAALHAGGARCHVQAEILAAGSIKGGCMGRGPSVRRGNARVVFAPIQQRQQQGQCGAEQAYGVRLPATPMNPFPPHPVSCCWSAPDAAEYRTGEAFWAGSDLVRGSGGEAGPGVYVVLSGVIRRVHQLPDGTAKVGRGGWGGAGMDCTICGCAS